MKKGFTLIETLIYISILGMVLVSFVTYTYSISNNREKTYVVQEVHANSRMALEIIRSKIHLASAVNTASSTFGVDPGFLSLSMNNIAKNPTVIGLSQDDGILLIKEGSSATTSITSDETQISNLVFTDLTGSGNKKNIKINMTVEFNNPSGDQVYDFSQDVETSISLRK